MSATNSFFVWFYYGLNGLGGWFIFLLLALAAVIWMLYDSTNRNIPALGWRTGVILTAFLLLPAILFRFTVTDLTSQATSPLAPFAELIFYLGLLGGILPVILAVGYFVSYQGMGNHEPEPSFRDRVVVPPLEPDYRGGQKPVGSRLERRVPKAHAWLISSKGDHQLNQGVTTIGRSARNDIALTGDSTMSREHAKILEQNGHYRLVDLGSKSGTRVNGHLVREQVMLDPDDEIQFGDKTVVHFVTSHR